LLVLLAARDVRLAKSAAACAVADKVQLTLCAPGAAGALLLERCRQAVAALAHPDPWKRLDGHAVASVQAENLNVASLAEVIDVSTVVLCRCPWRRSTHESSTKGYGIDRLVSWIDPARHTPHVSLQVDRLVWQEAEEDLG
jgi:hypothetical protein